MEYALWCSQLLTTAILKVIQMALSREIQGLCFYALFVRQIIDSYGCTFAFSEYNTIYMHFQWTRKSSCSKINLIDLFDSASAKKRNTKRI